MTRFLIACKAFDQRVAVGFSLLRCALLHGLTEHRGGYRCFNCNPLRKHERKSYPLLEEK